MSDKEISFEKGKSGNVAGKPPESFEWKRLKKELKELVVKIMFMKSSEWDAYKSKDPTIAELTVKKYIDKYPDLVMDRFLGRVPTTLEINGGDDMTPFTLGVTLDPEILRALARRPNS